jgi:hypothetical protein
LIEYAAIVLVALWAFKVFWLNPHDNKIAAQERAKVSGEIKKDYDKRYQKTIKGLEEKNASLEERALKLERANTDLARLRESMVSGFNKTLATIKQIEDSNNAEDRNIPDYLLGQRLSDVSNAIECAKPANKGRTGCPDSKTDIGPTP